MAQRIKNISNRAIIPKSCRERFAPLSAPGVEALTRCGVEAAGLSVLRAPFRIARSQPGIHVAIFTLGGSAQWRTPDAAGRFKPGELWVGGAGMPYEYWAGANWRVVWFHLSDAPRWKHLRASPPSARPSVLGARVEAAFEGLLAESAGLGAAASRQALSLYAELLALLLERELGRGAAGRSEAVRPHREALEALWAAVEADLAYPWRAQDLAAQLHVSPVHFFRLAAQYDGVPPMTRVAQLRLKRAAEMLRQTDYKLHQIAELVGYSTPFALSKAFRAHFGVSPRAYRRGG